MVSTPSQRRGRPSDPVKDEHGNPIAGFLLHKSSGRYYGLDPGTRSRVYFGRDFHSALVRFHAWQAVQHGESVEVSEDRSPDATELVQALHSLSDDPRDPPAPMPDWLIPVIEDIAEGRRPRFVVTKRHRIMADAFWAAVRAAILHDPMLAAQRTGLPLDRLHQFKPPGPSISLDALMELYGQKPLKPKTLRYTRQYWDEFCGAVGVKKAAEITADGMSRYLDQTATKYAKLSPANLRLRYGAVKAVFAWGLKRGQDPENLQHALTLCKMLVPPRAPKVNPQDVGREDFIRLLDAADAKWKAILLLSLNCAFYPVDIAAVRKAAIDLDKLTYRDTRTKTGVPRVAVLWKRTADAVRACLAAHPNGSEYMFVTERGSRRGLPYADPDKLTRHFRELRKLAGVPHVEFSHIRDGAQTAAIEGGANPIHVDILLGHRTGIKDAYLMRKPGMVADACAAIERAYFA